MRVWFHFQRLTWTLRWRCLPYLMRAAALRLAGKQAVVRIGHVDFKVTDGTTYVLSGTIPEVMAQIAVIAEMHQPRAGS